MKSMTGFGRAEGKISLGKVTAEARTENHRFLDINFQLPDIFLPIEQELTDIIKRYIRRGKVRILISHEPLKNRLPTINIELAKKSLETVKRLKKELKINEEIKLEHILMIKEFFSSETKPNLKKDDYTKLKEVLRSAILRLDKTRSAEGRKLQKDLKQRIANIGRIVTSIERERKNFTKETMERLRDRIRKLLENIQVDETRLYQEIAFLADRTDITEEITRLRAHISRFRELLTRTGPVGKELDFLIQEMHREAVTISAKSKKATISHLVIKLKSEMEKLREQVQNIE
ncbi:hypothetical protein HRbin37_00118 [bacterium HR37]|nr:hypothetical protein HRbin37_00118 [bacterium HR37]